MKLIKSEINKPVMKVTQPLADFYIFTIKAKELLKICEPVRLEDGEELGVYGDGNVPFSKVKTGTQRKKNPKQISQIRDYITSGDAAFPNTIILGANLSSEGYQLSSESSHRWFIKDNQLTIPSGSNSASIIDGQHRVLGFKKLYEEDESNEYLDMDVVCALYLDLPLTYHAQIFTHINSTPRRVNRNLIYQLYQIDMDEKRPDCWSPEVLSVYIARSLDSDSKSLLKDRLRLSVKERKLRSGWNYTFASVVESILPLISSNPIKDRNILAIKTKEISTNEKISFATRDALSESNDKAPFRSLYLKQKDSSLYDNILNFSNLIQEELVINNDSIFQKSIGISACFMALRDILLYSDSSYDAVLSALKKNLNKINIQELPDIPSTKVQGIVKNTIVLLVREDLRIDKRYINIKTSDIGDYDKLIS